MKIIREIASKKVLYLLDGDVSITEGGMVADSVMAYDIKPATHEIVEGDPPALWIGGGTLAYDGVWTVANQVVYDETITTNLATAKASKWEAIKATRDARKSGGALVGTKWFHTDADSRIQQLGLVLMGSSVPAVPWKTLDGTFTTMSQTLAGQIFAAVAALDMALFANAEAHRTAMEASANPDQYDFSAGWPDHFPI